MEILPVHINKSKSRCTVEEGRIRLGLRYIKEMGETKIKKLEEAREARRGAILHGEGEHWEQWGWLAEMELALGDSAAARSAMDSARARAASSRDFRQIDSVLVELGFRESGNDPPESARDSQNPRVRSQ